MHYSISDSVVIRSENAAKSISYINKYITALISTLPNECNALDYGCGKFRYTISLSDSVNEVVAIDSLIQISRTQIINGVKTNLIDYAKDYLNNVDVYSLEDKTWKDDLYDFILCTNVLSAIPFEEERKVVLSNICTSLSSSGFGLISVQFRNSRFGKFKSYSGAISYADGWVIPSVSGYKYYAIIPPKKMIELCEEAGLYVYKMDIKDGSLFAYVKNKRER